MAEAADYTEDSSAQSAHCSRDTSEEPVAPLGLEDVTEEEDVFLLESQPARVGSGTPSRSLDVEKDRQQESDFLHLTIRKQVSYR